MKKSFCLVACVATLCSSSALAKPPQQESDHAWLAEPAGQFQYETPTGCLVLVSKSIKTGESLRWSGSCAGKRASGDGTLAICNADGKVVATATGKMEDGRWKDRATASGTTKAIACRMPSNSKSSKAAKAEKVEPTAIPVPPIDRCALARENAAWAIEHNRTEGIRDLTAERPDFYSPGCGSSL